MKMTMVTVSLVTDLLLFSSTQKSAVSKIKKREENALDSQEGTLNIVDNSWEDAEVPKLLWGVDSSTASWNVLIKLTPCV